METKQEIHRDVSATIDMAKSRHVKLEQDLIECRKSNSRVFNMSTTTTTPSATSTPSECLTATNLTQTWRLDHKGGNIRPGGPHSFGGWTCDFNKGLKWFRFSGDGGM